MSIPHLYPVRDVIKNKFEVIWYVLGALAARMFWSVRRLEDDGAGEVTTAHSQGDILETQWLSDVIIVL